MAKSGAQPGNQNARGKRTPWRQALKRALARHAAENGEENPNYRRGLDAIAKKVIEQAIAGDDKAWQEIANRIEGKVGTTVEVVGDPKRPVGILPMEFVNSRYADDPTDTE